jgi:galactokinase
LSSTPNKQGQSRALPPDGARQFRAPARVNLIGEHTDYNDGLVLPTTTALFTSVTATPRADRIVKVTSGQMQDTQGFDLDDVELVEKPQWIDYAKGVAAEIEMEGVRLLGADLHIESDIPLGGGLSSSASFELQIVPARRKSLCRCQLRHHGPVRDRMLRSEYGDVARLPNAAHRAGGDSGGPATADYG